MKLDASSLLQFHLRSYNSTSDAGPADDTSRDQAFWIGTCLGLFLGFLAAVVIEHIVEFFLKKDPRWRKALGQEPLPAREQAAQAGESVQNWLAQCSEAEARTFLANFARGPRGHLLGEVAGRQAPLQFVVRADSVGSQAVRQESLEATLFKTHRTHQTSPQVLRDSPEPQRAQGAEGPVVQFTEFNHYVCEGEECARLEVVRSEPLHGYTEVAFETIDSSAIAGTSYVETKGRLVFQPNERSQWIEVPIIDNGHWDAALQFKVQLTTSGLVNAHLSHEMWHARVQVIDTGTFPTDKFKAHLQAGKAHDLPKFELLREYFVYNFSNKRVRLGTLKMVLVQQCHILNFFLRLCLTVYLVDILLTPAIGQPVTQAHVLALAAIGLLYLLPVMLLHFLDYHALTMGVKGISKLNLQKAIVAKFLHYGQESRQQLRPGGVNTAMMHDAEDLVDRGYMPVVGLSAVAGDMVALMAFQFLVPVMFGRPFNPSVFAGLILLPVAEISLLFYRRERTNQQLEMKHDHFEAVSNSTHELVDHYDITSAFNRLHLATDHWTELVMKKNQCDNGTDKLCLNNAYVGNWCLAIVLGFYFILAGRAVIVGELQVGLFLANMNLFQAISGSCERMEKLLMDMQQATPALVRICVLLNLPDDLTRKKQLLQRAEVETQQFLEGGSHLTLDDLPIRVVDVQFRYNKNAELALWEPVNLRGVLQIQQGTLVSLVGKRREGKTTLLKLLGGELLLQDESVIGPRSQVYVPPHLRVIHMRGDSIFFEGSLYENLIYGVSHSGHSKVHHSQPALSTTQHLNGDGSVERVLKICQMVGLSEDIMRYVQSDESHAWNAVLSSTDSFLLSLARAFIANPQVLCLHKPTLLFDEISSQRILELLRRFVMERGLVQEQALRDRSPRTCIFTSAKIAGVEISDQVFHVSRAHGIQPVEKDKVTAEMLA